MSPEQEELDRQMRSWRMELFALGARCPLAKGKPSLGLLAIFDTVTATMKREGVVDFRFLTDWICRVEEEEQGPGSSP